MSESSIYAPDYLRKQGDKQLHFIAELIENNISKITNQNQRIEQLQTENAELKAEKIAHLLLINDQVDQIAKQKATIIDQRDMMQKMSDNCISLSLHESRMWAKDREIEELKRQLDKMTLNWHNCSARNE